MFRFNNWIRLNYTLNREQLAKLEYTELFITKRINVKFLESFPAWFATLYSVVRSFPLCRDRYKLQRTTDIKISNGTNENRGIESILTSIVRGLITRVPLLSPARNADSRLKRPA